MQDWSVGRTMVVLAASLFAAGGVAAAGAQSPLPPDNFTLPKGFKAEPTMHALKSTLVAQLRPAPQDLLADAMKQLLAEREGWLKVPAKSASTSYAMLPTTKMDNLFAVREAWGKGAAPKKVAAPLAAGAVSPLPSGDFEAPKGFTGEPKVNSVQPTSVAQLTPVPQAQIDDAMRELLATRKSWGTEPSKAGTAAASGSAGYAVLPTTSVADLFAAREAWGMGKAKKVVAPLATGAYSPLPSENFELPKGFEGEATVSALKSTPVAQLTPVPQAQIDDAMKKLLATRESWGTEPSKAGTAAASGSAGYAVLPTTHVADLFAAREAWGMGTAKKVAAPLAAGVKSPLPSGDFKVPEGFSGEPTVHALKSTPVAQLTPIPQDQLADAMKKLMAEREGWMKAPAKSANSGYAVLPTTNVANLFAARDAWGMGTAKKVAAPLAAGVKSPLPSGDFKVPEGFSGEPTVHALKSTPVAQLTPVPQAQIDNAMKKLLATRESWGTDPSKGGTVAGGGSAGYAVLPTTNVADLFAVREAWGMGKSKKVAAPLAAGVKSPLPSGDFKVPEGFSGEPIVHALKSTPVAQLMPVPQAQIDDTMKKLLATRESWGTKPSKAGAAAAPAPQRSAEAADCEAKLRDAASKGVILFASSSANLSARSNATLDALAKVAKGCSKGRIRVEGHTDSTGRASFNKTLSERRAMAVANYLTKAGVKKDRVEAVGYGQEKPVASNNTAQGRAKNRRIEFTVVE